MRALRAGTRATLGPALAGAAAALAVTLTAPSRAEAHALVGRQDLPIPEWLFAWGASLVLIVSFVGLTVAWRRPLLEERNWKPALGWLSTALLNPVTEVLAGLAGVFLLAVTVWSAIEGTDAPDRNFSLTFVFVTFWLGMVVLSVLFGNVFRAFNPWRAIGRVAGAGFRLIAGQRAPHLDYPERLGCWPAVAGLVGFLWLELISGSGGVLSPDSVAVAVVVYSAITFACMAVFGTEPWIRRGETFSVYMEMFSRLSVLEVREGRLGTRRFLSGLADWVSGPGYVGLVLVTIGGTAFDGAQEGDTMGGWIRDVFNWGLDAGFGANTALRISNTLFLALTILAVAGIYWLGVRGMRTVDSRLTLDQLGRKFGHAFVPIALAYLVAHYFSLVIFQEQAQFTYLLSDPLGDGSDIFGTAGTQINYGAIGATAIWYIQVGALVVGHVIALALGHDRAISLYGEPRKAARSQYWMLALMVGFTCLGLFLLSQANG
jgi:hypothetical protein